MDPKNRGTIGIFFLAALCPNLGCKCPCAVRDELSMNDWIRQGYPNIRTVDHWIGEDKSERFPQSRYALLLLLCTSVVFI